MHADEIETDEALVRRLLAAQFPDWAELPIEALPVGGTDNAIYRLGDGALRPSAATLELDDRLAGQGVRVAAEAGAPPAASRFPTPVARGAPGEGYPHEWAVYDWLDGQDAASATSICRGAAIDLAEFLARLRRIEPAGGPPARRPRRAARAPRRAHAHRDRRTRRLDRRRSRHRGLGARARRARLAPAARLDPRRPRRAEPARRGRANHRGPRLGLPLCRRSGMRREGCVGRPRRRDAPDLPRAARTRRRDLGTRARLGALAGDDALPYYLHTYPVIVQQARRWLAEALAG